VPDGLAEDLGAFCEQYERMIQEAGGVDLQVLGIGRDGHLGFNEPGSSLGSPTQVVALAPETIEDNARFFESEDEVPRFAITMGIQTILDAGHCLMLASGESKADAVKGCVEGPVTSMLTASALQLHPNATVIVDEAAASKLERRDHYKWVQQAKQEIADKL
jgi:glucosamine-6-phosphate deaminase